MAKRKRRESPEVHQIRILEMADAMIQEKGIEQTTMDGIAKKLKYSKATLYRHFGNKKELVGKLAYKVILGLYGTICLAVAGQTDIREKFYVFCNVLEDYMKTYPFYVGMIWDAIGGDMEKELKYSVFNEIHSVGLQLKEELSQILREGVRENYFREDLDVEHAAFYIWNAIYQIGTVAEQKEKYVANGLGMSCEEYCKESYDFLLLAMMK